MEAFLFIGFVVVIFAVAIAAGIAQAKKVRESWTMFARAHGLTFVPGSSFLRHSMNGHFQGCFVNVFTETRGSGKSRTTYTLFSVPARVPQDLNLYQQGAFSFLNTALGIQDIQTGDSDLDARFVIQGRDPRGIANLLTHPRVRHCLLSVGATQSGLRVSGSQAIVEVRGVPHDMAVLQRCLAGAIQVATALDEAMGGAPVVAPAAFTPPPPLAGPAAARGAIELFSGAGAAAAVPLYKQPQKVPDSKLRPRVDAPSDAPQLGALVKGPMDGTWPVPLPPVSGKAPSSIAARPEMPPAPEQFGAWGAESPAPSVGKGPKPPAETAAPVLEDVLKRLTAPGVPSAERDQLIAAIVGKPCAFIGAVERVDWTSDLSLPDEMRSGRTAICKYAGATIAARFPESRNAALDALAAGAPLQVLGLVIGWDDFYGRLLVNVS